MTLRVTILGEPVTFVIPGEPAGWRIQYVPRKVGRGRIAKVFVDTPLSDVAQRWQKPAIKQLRYERGPTIHGPVSVSVYSVWPRNKDHDCTHTPRGWDPGRKKPCPCPPEKLDGRARWKTSVPDHTNVFKLAEDALVKAGVIEDDRAQVLPGGVDRFARRGEEPHVRIVVRVLPEWPGADL